MGDLMTRAATVASLVQAVRSGRLEEGRLLAAALRLEWPTAVDGWLWGAWLHDEPGEALALAQRAVQLEATPPTLRLLRWATANHAEEGADVLALEELCALLGQSALPDPAPTAAPAAPVRQAAARPDAAVGLLASLRAQLRPSRPVRWYDGLLVLWVVALVGVGGWLALRPSQARRAEAAPPAAPLNALQQALALKRQAGERWVAGDRAGSVLLWQEAHRLAPDNLDIADSLARAHVALSTEALTAGAPERAFPHLQAALALMPDEVAVQHEFQALVAYRTGRDAVAAGQWALAEEALGPLFVLDAGYLDVRALLEQTVAGQQEAAAAQRAQHDGALSGARGSEPGQLLRALLSPPELSNQPGQSAMPPLDPFANPSRKHVVVSINAQRMYVYENGQLRWEWIASTGEAERPTVPGRYRIQSKIENARSNVWSLWMPYWQGIYWAGSVENGIHGQVTFDAGGRLWEGYLGTRITFGCVMISDEHAAQLFEWSDVGTPVSIHWQWDPAWLPNDNGDPGG